MGLIREPNDPFIFQTNIKSLFILKTSIKKNNIFNYLINNLTYLKIIRRDFK
jgi:hypothetical protein